MKTNHTPPLILTEAADMELIAAISMAIERYIAQVSGFAMVYQLTTCDIDIIITKRIGIKNIPLIKPFLVRFRTLDSSKCYLGTI